MSIGLRWFKNAAIPEILSVACVEEIGSISWQKLYRNFPSLPAIVRADEKELVAMGLTENQAKAFKRRPQNTEAMERLLLSKKIKIITIEDPLYPQLLREIDDPPLWLFARGSTETLKNQSKNLTIVGTRKPTAYAKSALDKILSDELVRNVCLVSGLAYGIDALTHQKSLVAHSATIAVLAGGLDSIYPVDHTRLAESIVDSGGMVISEYPPLSRPRPYRFPVRNRIIAGLSPLTVVVEAAIKSGTLTTAKSALDYNRDIFAVPGDILRSSAEGTNFLIKKGATLLDSPDQLFSYYNLKAIKTIATIDKSTQNLLDLLSDNPLTIDQLVQISGKSVDKILGIMTELELNGSVYQNEIGGYTSKK
jgi:DNA processing protein